MSDPEGKRCARCRLTKPFSDFGRKYGSVFQPYCRSCQAAYKQEHYAKHREKYICQARQRRIALRKEIRALKSRPCADCGVSYPYYVMDFDHREGETKISDMNGLVVKRGCSMKVLRAEIAKCDLVCANCHRERSYQRNRKKARQSATPLL